MPRIRTIKPETWADEKLASLPRDARLLFIGMWNFADDSGRLRGSPALIRAQVFPYDSDLDVGDLIEKLEDAGFVAQYRVDDQSYIWIVNFNKHQKIDKPTPSNLPPFDESSPKARRVLAVGKERKGKEEERIDPLALTDADASSAPAASKLVSYIRQEWPDIKKADEFEGRAQAACPGINLLAEARKARGWELSDPKHIKRNHGRFLWGWFNRAQDQASRSVIRPQFARSEPDTSGSQPRPIPPPKSTAEIEAELEERGRKLRAAQGATCKPPS